MRGCLAFVSLFGLSWFPSPNFCSAPEKIQTAPGDQVWTILSSGQDPKRDTNLRGLSAAVAGSPTGWALATWAAGSNGTILRSADGGKTWTPAKVPGAETLDFRAIRAFSERVAYAMSSGEGEKSRIYKTTDGGANWKLQYTGPRKEFFLDALICDYEPHCFALGDPVDGKFVLLTATHGDGWTQIPIANMPPPLKGEGAFAASGTSLAFCGNALLFGTGGPVARVFRSSDSGTTWSVAEVPIASGNPASGIFSVACAGNNVVAVGGNYQQIGATLRTAAYSTDGGITWLASPEPPSGYRSAVAVVTAQTFLAVGPNGTDISSDGGAHWRRVSETGFNALFTLSQDHVFAAGQKGAIAQFVLRP
jgi:photosystem II stability/assembly factor-like uncharacterized protein